jgi:hypothetical protein
VTRLRDDKIRDYEILLFFLAVPSASGYPNKIRHKGHPGAIPDIDRKASSGFLKPVALARNRAHDGKRSVSNILEDWRGK